MVEACHNLACRRHGAVDAYLKLHARTHQSLKYHVRHKFGVSESYYTFEQHPWHGAGQGAADAALRYIVLSDTLIDAYHTKVAPQTINDPTSTIQVIRSLKAFIDDVVLHATSTPETPFEVLQTNAQTQLQWWAQLVQVTGGALNPRKCCGPVYTWNPDKHGILRIAQPQLPETFIKLDLNQTHQSIPLPRINEGTRYLGLYTTVDRNTKPMESHIWEKAIVYVNAFHRTPMDRREASVLYRSCFLPAITYPLPATWLPDQFFEKLHRLSTSTLLNKMGFHKNLPRCLVFAPRTVGGIGLCNLQYEMEIQQVLILLRHMRAQTPLGHTFEILIRQYQLWAGIQNPVLVDKTPCPWVPDKWLSRLRRTLQTHNIKILHNSWTIPPLCHHDVFIMEAVLDLGLSVLQLEKINVCRMSLQVTTLAEITDHTGKLLLPQALLQPRQTRPAGLNTISHSKLQWPQTHNPSQSCWKFWTKTICNVFRGATNGTRLQHPLGTWTTQYETVRHWQWRLAPTGRLLHQAHANIRPRAALPTGQHRTQLTFLITVPTNQEFLGSPVTPFDQYQRYIQLPVIPLPNAPSTQLEYLSHKSLTAQFRTTLAPWQRPLFGPIRKLQLTP